jgi:hypothetical protein
VSPADIEKQDADGSESGSPNDPRGSIDVPKQYDTNRAKYAEEVFDCIYVSNKTGGRNAGERCYWASVLFTKFTTTAISLLKLLPKRTEGEGYVTFWHWWSSYAHSFPMSYYRMSEQSRGHGIQNDQDIMYIAASLEVILEFMKDSLGGMRGLFPDIVGPDVYLKDALAQRAAQKHTENPPGSKDSSDTAS